MPQRQIAHRAVGQITQRFLPIFQNGIWVVFDRHWFRPVAGPFETRKHVVEDMKEKGVFTELVQ